MPSYIWEKEKITIKLEGKKSEKNFLPLEIFDFPVEYISEDGKFYLLLLMDDESENGEWWYVVETVPEIVLDYLGGKISVRDIFDKNKSKVFIGFRSYEEYNTIDNLETLERKIKEGFIKKEDLPTYKAKMNIENQTLEKIKSLMRIPDTSKEVEALENEVVYGESVSQELVKVIYLNGMLDGKLYRKTEIKPKANKVIEENLKFFPLEEFPKMNMNFPEAEEALAA